MTRFVIGLGLLIAGVSSAQEARSGFDLEVNLTAEAVFSPQLTSAPRFGSGAAAGFRAMLYPTWKLSSHWSFVGSVQVLTRPYLLEQFNTQGSGVRADILQGHLDYSLIGKNSSIVVRAGQLSSAFGSFLLRYDDTVNPLTDMPLSYGYYYKPVTTYGLAGAQVDVTHRRLDARIQWVNSSPANRRSLADKDQYGNWAGGVGLTIAQGLRVGASGFYGPYLDRQYPYYFPGEARPRDLPASGVGIEGGWAKGHWNTMGELQWFTRDYRAIPTFTQRAGYIESRRTLGPRWFAAARVSFLTETESAPTRLYEIAIGFRPNTKQLLKVEYQLPIESEPIKGSGSGLVIQFVTSLHPISLARD